jgi:arginyl-tRNA synthetase
MADYKKKIINFLNKELKETLDENILKVPPSPEMGDYAFPCFILSKQLKKSPEEISKQLKKLKTPNFISKLESNGPYLNVFLNQTEFIKNTTKIILKEKEKYGQINLGKNKKVMIEFYNQNTHKVIHVGHLRNTVIGDFLVNLYNFTHHKAIPVSYLGDIGTHVAKSIWALEKFHKKGKLPNNKGKFLGEIYVKANKELEKNEKYKEEVSKTLKKLENGDPRLNKIWKETRKWSLDEFKEIAKQLNINIERYFLESEVEKPGQEIVDELIKKKLAYKDEGAILINLEKYKLKKFLLRKSDGTSLYSTKDLALAKIKFNEYNVDESIYLTGDEQKFYFQQLFKTLELIGFKKPMTHISHGLVKLKDGSNMSSRKGNVELYEDFYDKVLKKTIKDLKSRYKSWTKAKTEKIAKEIVIGAIKFTMLNQDSNKEVLFDIDKALSFEGDTCPYLQYSNARINSILKKVKPDKPDYKLVKMQIEFRLIKKLADFPEIIQKSNEKNSPHTLTNYLLDLARTFNEFYHSCHINQSKKGLKGARIEIIKATQQVFTNAFSILNIPLPKEM